MEPQQVDVTHVIKRLESKIGELMTTLAAQEIHIERLMQQVEELRTASDKAAPEQLTLEGVG